MALKEGKDRSGDPVLDIGGEETRTELQIRRIKKQKKEARREGSNKVKQYKNTIPQKEEKKKKKK